MFKDKTTLLVVLMATLMVFAGILLMAASIMLFTAGDDTVSASSFDAPPVDDCTPLPGASLDSLPAACVE